MAPRVNAVRNAHLILKFLADQQVPTGVASIARATGISPSSCFNILKTLVELKLVNFYDETKAYTLGAGLFELANGRAANQALFAAAQPMLTELAIAYSCQTGLWESSNETRTLIAMGESQSIASLNIRVGQTMLEGSGSSGKALIGKYLHDKKHLLAAYEAVQWQGEMTFDKYHRQVGAAVRDGYAIDRDAYYSGVTTISCAFDGSFLQRRFCVSLFLFSSRYSQSDLKDMGLDLKARVKQLTEAVLTSS